MKNQTPKAKAVKPRPTNKYQVSGWCYAKCRNCGLEQEGLKQKFGKWFEKNGWFRGDDDLIDCLCMKCLKDESVELPNPRKLTDFCNRFPQS